MQILEQKKISSKNINNKKQKFESMQKNNK